jgi:hypothetical protein
VTSRCGDVRERRVCGRVTAEDAAHVAACAACGAETGTLDALASAFAAHRTAPPSPVLESRVLSAATPILAGRRRHAARWSVAAAVAAALLPLPLIVAIDVWALQLIYGGLSRLLPPALSFYLVMNYAAVLALLGTLSYGAIPLLAERQARGRHEVLHG